MATLVKIGRKTFAAGVVWKNAKTKSMRAEAVTEAAELGVDSFVLRRGLTPQIGFPGGNDDLIKNGVIPLAAVAAGNLPGNALAVVELEDDLFWGVAIQDNEIHQDIVLTRDEIVVWFAEERTKPGYAYIGAPDFIGGATATPITLALFAEKRLLRHIGRFETVGAYRRKLIVNTSILVAGLLFGFGFYHHLKVVALTKQESALQMLRERQKMLLATITIQPVTYIPYRSMLSYCMTVLDRMPARFDNWVGVGLECRQRSIGIAYLRGPTGLGGSVKATFPGAKVKIEHDLATVHVPNPAWGMAGKLQLLLSNAPRSSEASVERVDDFFRKHGYVPVWSHTTASSLQRIATGYTVEDFKVVFPVMPDGWVYGLDQIPGAMARMVGFIKNAGKGKNMTSWQLTGRVFYLNTFKRGIHVVQGH